MGPGGRPAWVRSVVVTSKGAVRPFRHLRRMWTDSRPSDHKAAMLNMGLSGFNATVAIIIQNSFSWVNGVAAVTLLGFAYFNLHMGVESKRRKAEMVQLRRGLLINKNEMKRKGFPLP